MSWGEVEFEVSGRKVRGVGNDELFDHDRDEGDAPARAYIHSLSRINRVKNAQAS